MKKKEFRQLIKEHIWFGYTNGKIGQEWELPENYPKEGITGFTQKQAHVLGLIMGQLFYRKENDDFTKIYGVNDYNTKISKLIIAAIAEIPWDSVEWEPNEETKQAIRDARAGIGLKEFATVDKLMADLHIDDDN